MIGSEGREVGRGWIEDGGVEVDGGGDEKRVRGGGGSEVRVCVRGSMRVLMGES